MVPLNVDNVFAKPSLETGLWPLLEGWFGPLPYIPGRGEGLSPSVVATWEREGCRAQASV